VHGSYKTTLSLKPSDPYLSAYIMSPTPEILTKREYLKKHFATTYAWGAQDIHSKQASKWWINKTPKDVSSLSEPYYAPGNHDPPIPTAADIASAQRIDRYKPVYRVFGKYVAKRLSSFIAFMVGSIAKAVSTYK
jgi:hypothetical protein